MREHRDSILRQKVLLRRALGRRSDWDGCARALVNRYGLQIGLQGEWHTASEAALLEGLVC